MSAESISKFAMVEQERVERKFPNMSLLYHGTDIKNAQSLMMNLHNRVSNLQLAQNLCASFKTTLNDVTSDPENYGFFEDFVFADNSSQSREKHLYTTNSLELATSYASRGPEWRYHLLMYFASKELGLSFNPMSHQAAVEEWISKYRETPAIVVFDASLFPDYPKRVESPGSFSRRDTVILSYPLPDSISVLDYFACTI